MKRLISLFALLLLAVPGVASAESVSDVATALRGDPVYESVGVDLLDQDALRSVLTGDRPTLYVAALAAGAATSDVQARARAVAIGREIRDSDSVVLVITASQHVGTGQGSGAVAMGVNAPRALGDVTSIGRGARFDKEHVTQFVKDFKARLEAQASGHSSSGSTSTSPSTTSSGHGGRNLLLALLVLGGIGFFLYSRNAKAKRAKVEEGLRADVEQLYNRLGSEVSLLDAKDNAVAKQALADASERYNSCGAALESADTPGEYAAARRTAVEGLTAARVARKELGLDPGPEIPLPAGAGPQLTQEQQLQMGDQTVYGSPQYAPGRQHYFGGGMVGGQMVSGGWYSMPFWEPFLLGSMLSGGLGGGGLFGGGYGGYGAGYEEGREDAQQSQGGDWGGGGGGGDWGGGGGDWGGGGDGGGGGGDW